MLPLIRIGTRDSRLALWQAEQVQAALEALPTPLNTSLHAIKAIGDTVLDIPLHALSHQQKNYGVFVKELENHLLAGEVDIAVHSLKDMPSHLPDGLAMLPFGERESVADAWVQPQGIGFYDLPAGSVVGTSSLRRTAQLQRLRGDLVYTSIRGNVQTRLRKLEAGEVAATLLAEAGLRRLGLASLITHTFCPHTELIPAVGQGTLAIEFQGDNALLTDLLARFVNPQVLACTLAERALMARLEGGCQLPLGAYASWNAALQAYTLTAQLLAPLDADGGCSVSPSVVAGTARFQGLEDASLCGKTLAETLLAQGGEAIKASIAAQRV